MVGECLPTFELKTFESFKLKGNLHISSQTDQ